MLVSHDPVFSFYMAFIRSGTRSLPPEKTDYGEFFRVIMMRLSEDERGEPADETEG